MPKKKKKKKQTYRQDILNAIQEGILSMSEPTFTLEQLIDRVNVLYPSLDVSHAWFRRHLSKLSKDTQIVSFSRKINLWVINEDWSDEDDIESLEEEYENMDLPDDDEFDDLLEPASLDEVNHPETDVFKLLVKSALNEYISTNFERCNKQIEDSVRPILHHVVSETWREKVIPAVTKNIRDYCKSLIDRNFQEIYTRLSILEGDSNNKESLKKTLEDIIEKL